MDVEAGIKAGQGEFVEQVPRFDRGIVVPCPRPFAKDSLVYEPE